MQKWIWKVVYCLFALIAFAIPIEHKYDKPLRFFSKSLIPKGLELPSWFDKKIYFHPSDLIALALILLTLFVLKIPFRKLFLQRSSSLIWLLIALIALSIAASPLSTYALLYFRLWQWMTGAFIFGILAGIDEIHKKTLTKWILLSMISMGILQSSFAIAQYFHQGSFGLRILGEPNFNHASHSSAIWCPEGARWIVDRLLGLDFGTTIVVRPMGTTPHPNVLGGFLALTGLASLSFLSLSKRKFIWSALIFLQFFALTITYSRGALFSYLIGVAIWFGWNWRTHNRKELFKTAILLGSISFFLLILFHEQLAWRGGVFSSTKVSQRTHVYRSGLEHIAWRMIEKEPLFGVGFLQFSLRGQEFIEPEKKSSDHINGVHSIYLILAAESGLLALLCFVGFVASILLRAVRAEPTPYIGSLIAMFIAILLIGGKDFYPLSFQIGKLLFFLTAGLLAAHNASTSRASIPVPLESLKIS